MKELTEMDFAEKGKSKKDDASANTNYSKNTVLKGEYDTVVGSKIKEVSESASSFGTTLWFTDNEVLDKMLDKLLATGQFTMCYNMLAYLETMIYDDDNGFKQLDIAVQKDIKALYQQSKDDWFKFKEDPMFLCVEMSS